jgi:hypothetical protein
MDWAERVGNEGGREVKQSKAKQSKAERSEVG